jgi:hypothetical protein
MAYRPDPHHEYLPFAGFSRILRPIVSGTSIQKDTHDIELSLSYLFVVLLIHLISTEVREGYSSTKTSDMSQLDHFSEIDSHGALT